MFIDLSRLTDAKTIKYFCTQARTREEEMTYVIDAVVVYDDILPC